MLTEEILEEAFSTPSKFAEHILKVKPYDYQKAFLDNNDRMVVFRAGRKAGKTFCASVKAIYKAITEPNSTILLIAPTLRQAQIIFWEIERLLTGSMIEFMIERKTQTMIWFKNKSSIHAVPSGRTGATVRGFTPKMIIVDESAFVPDEVLKSVLPSLLGQKGTIIMCSTPFGKRGYFYEASLRWTEFYAKSTDNPMVQNDPLFVEEIKRLTKEEYAQEVEAEFLSETDNFLSRDLILECVYEGKLPTEVEGTYMGVDIARYGHDSTVFTIGVYAEERMYVVKVEEMFQASTVEVIGKIKDLNREYLFNAIKVDETGLGAGVLDQLKVSELPVEGVTFSLKSKEDMYRNLKVLMERGRLKIPQHTRLLNQLASLRVKYSASGNMQVYSDGHEDYADSLALLCSNVSALRKGTVDVLDGGGGVLF